MSALQLAEISASPDLRKASERLSSAQSRKRAVEHAAAAHSADITNKRERLAELREDDASHRIAMALGDAPEGTAASAVEIISLERDLEVADAVSAEFKQRSNAATANVTDARQEYYAVARGVVETHALQPAHDAFMTALDGVKNAAIDLMVAHNICHVEFAKSNHYSGTIDFYGPAAHVMEAIINCRWGGYPGDVRPEWAPQCGPRMYPWTLPGMEQADKAIRSAVDQAGVA